jgi:hypothetical protein
MKKSILIITSICLIALVSFKAEKYYTLKFTEAALNKHFQNLGTIKQLIEKSNLPHQEVVFVANSIDSIQLDIVNQVKAQTQAPAK